MWQNQNFSRPMPLKLFLSPIPKQGLARLEQIGCSLDIKYPNTQTMKRALKLRTLLGAATLGLALSVAHAQDPGEIEILAWWDFEDSDTPEVAVDAINGIVGEIDGAEYAEGRNGGFSMNFDTAEGGTVAVIGTEDTKAGFLNKAGARDQISYVYWQKWDVPVRNSSAFWARAEGMDRATQAHTPWSNNNIYFDSTGGCCDAGTQRTQVPASDVPFEEWVHFSIIKDKSIKRIYADGVLLIENENTGELNEAFEDLFIGSAQDGSNSHGGRLDDFAVFAGALSEEQVIALADPGNSILTLLDNSNPGINLNADQKLSAGTLPALTAAQEIRFSIKNTVKPDDERGPITLEISSLEITGGDTDNFTLVSFPSTIEPGASDDIVLSFDNRGQFGAFAVSLNAKTNDEDADDQDFTFTAGATVLNPVGPIAHYRLDETSTDDGVADATGLGRSGTYRLNDGSVTLGTDALKEGTGTAATFSAGGSVAIGTLPTLTDYTVSLLLNPSSLGDLGTQDFRTVFAKGEDTPVFGLLEGNGELVWFGEADGVADALFFTEGLGLQAGTTYHVAMSYDSASQTGTIFVDGAEVASSDVDTFEDTGEFYLGAFGEGALPFDGTLDDVQVYDLVLDEAQIAFLIANPGQPLVPVGEIDTDLDGLTDDAEANEHNTDPLVADTDGDGLNDGQEVNDTKTDPLLADTDGDGGTDGAESIFGADPLDAENTLGEFLVRTVKASAGTAFGSMEAFKDALEDQSQISEEVAGNFTYVNFRDNAQGNFANDEVPFALWDNFGGRDDFGIHVTGKIKITEAGVRTFGMNSDDGNQLLIDGTLVAEDPGTHGSQDVFGSVDLTEGEHDIEMFFYERGGGAQVELFVNTELGSVETFDAGNFVLLPGFGTPSADSDGDGMSDFWEIGFFGDLSHAAEEDADGDDLSNIDEEAARTNPTVADTDGDTVNDGQEVADASDPNSPDTDGDGLTDGDEKARGTSPTSTDTDGDEFPDGYEVAQGSDPLDPASPGALPDPPESLVAFWSFNEGTTSDVGGFEGELRGGAEISSSSDGVTGAALDLGSDQGGQSMLVPDTDFFNALATEDALTITYWQKLRTVVNQTTFKGRSPISSGGERGISVHTPWGDRNFYYDTAGCCDGTQRTNVGVDVDYLQWHHIAFTKNGPVKKIFVDGVEQIEGANDAPLPTDFTELWIGSGTDGSESMAGLLDDFAIFNEALDVGEITYMASGGRYKVGGGPNLLINGSFEEPALENINTNNLGTVPTGWSQTGPDATWNLIRNDGSAYGSGVDNAADGSQIIDLNGVFEMFQEFTLSSDSDVTFGASFANREGHDGSTPSTVGIYDAAGENLLSPEVSVDTSGEPTPSEIWLSGQESVSLTAGTYQIRIALNNFNNVDAVFVTGGGGGGGNPPTSDDVPVIGTVISGPNSTGLSFTGLAGKTYDIQYSEDLIDWSIVAMDLSGEVNYEDTDAARQGRAAGYYRAVQK